MFFLSNIDQTYAAYITKKSDTSKAVERIEKEFVNGNITKAECVKQKSKALKLEKVSDTICDNVEVKTVKKYKRESRKEKWCIIQCRYEWTGPPCFGYIQICQQDYAFSQ